MSTLLEQTVCLDLVFRRPGMTRKLRAGSEVEVRKILPTTDATVEAAIEAAGLAEPAPLPEELEAADQTALTVGKTILRSTQYKTIVSIIRECRTYVARHSLPSPFKRGTYLLPLPAVEVIYATLEAKRDTFNAAVDAFLAEYDAMKAEAKTRLRELYDEGNYPPPAVLRAGFGMQWQLLEFGVPGETKLTAFLYEQEKEKAAASLKNAEVEIMIALRAAFRDLVHHLGSRLTTAPGAEKKIFKASTVENVLGFIETFQTRNILNDDDLETLVAQTKDMLAGRDVKQFRTDDTFRQEVSEAMGDIAGTLDEMLTDMPRAFDFREGDDGGA